MVTLHARVSSLTAVLEDDHVASTTAMRAMTVGGEKGLIRRFGVALHDLHVECAGFADRYHLALGEGWLDRVRTRPRTVIFAAIEEEREVCLRAEQGRAVAINDEVLVVLHLEVVPCRRIVAQPIRLLFEDHGTGAAVRFRCREGSGDCRTVVVHPIPDRTEICDMKRLPGLSKNGPSD